jgi:hypothetical protein
VSMQLVFSVTVGMVLLAAISWVVAERWKL